MPKDEFHFEDPFELNGIAFPSDQDTTDDMAECFTEEFMRMGYNHRQILALFRNPHYLGPNTAFAKRGEPFIRDLVAEVFARRGRIVTWPDSGCSGGEAPQMPPGATEEQNLVPPAAATEREEGLTDPMGSPIRKVNV